MTLTLDRAGERLDAAIARLVPSLSRNAVQRLFSEGLVRMDGKCVKKSEKTVPGAVLELTLPGPKPTAAKAEAIPLDVVFEDEDVIVVNKPKGMVVHPAAGHWEQTLVNALLHHCRDSLSGIGGELRPGIVHRIDKETSGLLIAAKNDFSHQKLAAQLKDHTLCRTYECIVCGNLREDEGTIDAPIGRNPKERKKMAIVPNGKRAVTHYRVLERFGSYTHLECRLETGRTHQIRVHLASKGHPIVGDTVYGRKKPELSLHSQCLHARQLTFVHPRTGKPITVSCDLPDYFVNALTLLQK